MTHKKERKKKKKKNKERRESRDRTCCPCRERERSEGTEDSRHSIDVEACRSARSNFGEEQRTATSTEGGWVEKNLRCGFNLQSKRL